MKTPLARTLSVSLLMACASASAADYQGADAVLQQLDAVAKETPPAPDQSDPNRQLREAIKAFKDRSPALSPEESAQGWIDLLDGQIKSVAKARRAMETGQSQPVRIQEVFNILPPPAAWEALAGKIQARPVPTDAQGAFVEQLLRVMAAALQKNEAAGWEALAAMEKQAATLGGEGPGSMVNYTLQNLNQAMAKRSSDPQRALGNFERQLAKLGDKASDPESLMRESSGARLEVPDLVTLAGPERAEALLRRVFALPLPGVSFAKGDRTKSLARRVASDMGKDLKFAPWALAQNVEAVDLYEALEKRFPAAPGANNPYSDSGKRDAEGYYLLGLVIKGRPADAAALAVKLGKRGEAKSSFAGLSLPYHALEELAQKGYAAQVADFFTQLLQEHPELPYWKNYITASTLAGNIEPMLAFVRALSERENLPPGAKLALRDAYGQALLAADRVPEGIKVWRDLLAATSKGKSEGEKSQPDKEEGGAPYVVKVLPGGAVVYPEPSENEDGDGDSSKGWRGRLDLAVNLAGLGRLLGDDALLNEGLDAVVALSKPDRSRVSPDTGDSLDDLFLAAGRGPELERLLTAALVAAERKTQAQAQAQAQGQNGSFTHSFSYLNQASAPLLALAEFYYRAGRYQDVVALLDRAKTWGAADLSAIISQGYTGRSFGYEAARSLQRVGRTAEALRVVNAYLDRNGGSDPAYALLLELSGPDAAVARLDELFHRDRFEERPLIWKAALRLGQSQLDEAEALVRQAIAIDPSDGEQGRGDRMRAYAVLADILGRKGDAEQAEHMAQAVKAIRLSEEADRYHGAGLLTHAVAMYKEALGFFADAYCVQSRLAIQLAALGRMDEAEAHYIRAYELMPDSFGRMESHCFGCEGAFRGEWAQNVAEKVFLRLAAENPLKPQVHYLLGYLRETQDQNAKALEAFQQAVKLDPDYLNAWKHVVGLAEKPADRDAAILNLLRLDPLQRRESAGLNEVGDLRALWQAVEAAGKFQVPAPAEVYPLASSKEVLEAAKKQMPRAGQSNPELESSEEFDGTAEFFVRQRETRFSTPVKAVVSTDIIGGVMGGLEQIGYFAMQNSMGQ